VKETPNAWMPQQFDNPANTAVHRNTTAIEILTDFPDGIDYLITGVGTGGHITGVTEVLKEKFHNLKTFAVEPELSPVLSGGAPGPHPLQGLGAGFVPSILDTTTDRGVLKDLDFRIARKIVQVATGRPGVRGFRQLPPAALYRDMGLASLVHLRNLR